MRRWISLCAVLVSGSLVLADGAGLEAAAQLQQAFPEVRFLREGPDLVQVYGTEFGYGLTPEASAENFVWTFGEIFGVAADELLPATPDETFQLGYTLPLLYDAESDTYKATMVCYRQYRGGLPVYGADLRLLVANAPGHPLVLANSTVRALGDYEVPRDAAARVREGAAHAAAAAFEPGLIDFGPSELVIWPDPDGQPRTPQVALTFVGAGVSPSAEPKKWRFVCEAASGAILHAEDMILFTDVVGNVSGMATTIPKAEQCNPEVATVMPWAKVAIGSTEVYADAAGNFTIPNAGSSPVTVTSYMSGYRFTVDNVAGAEETLTMEVTPPGPANFMHNAANNSEAVRAQVNGYVQANVVRDWVLVQHPTYPTIATQTFFPVYVMRTSGYCPGNAWYDYSSINFCAMSGSYANTAYSSVIHHEYGHHIVQSGGSGQDQYGEGVGDSVAVLLADDPILGYGFYYNNCNSGIRTADNTMQYPCTSDIHTCAQLLSGCIWSTRNELLGGGHLNYLEVLSKLMINSVPLHGSGGSITPAIGTTFLALDNTYYGGAHADHITAGFLAHNMIPGPPPANDDCGNAIIACPGNTYTGSTASATNDGSASCGSSTTSPDVWFKYTPVSSGSAHLETCDSNYDTVLSVHTGCPGTSGNQIGCADDTGWFGDCGWLPTSQSSLTVSVTGGTTYYIRVSGKSGDTGAYVLYFESGPACAPSDTTPPTPNPMTFAVPPAPVSASAISMTATTASDATPPVQYEFEFVSGGAGGNSSSWQTSTQYVDSGLSPDVMYTYRVRARDSVSPPNVGNFSANASATTWANVPAAPTLSNATSSTMNLDVNPNGNPSHTVFAIRCAATNPSHPVWDGMYVNAGGQPSATAVWQTDSQWNDILVTGLNGSTTYTFTVKARNQQGVETAFGPAASLATTVAGLKGDLNCDASVNFGDINPFVLRLADPGAYAAAYPGCPDYNGDINDDGSVNFADINPFIALLSGP